MSEESAIGRRILQQLETGPRSLGELDAAFPDVGRADLQAETDELERRGRVAEAHLLTDPPRTLYRLT